MYRNAVSSTMEFGFGNVGAFKTPPTKPRLTTRFHSLGRFPSSCACPPPTDQPSPMSIQKTLVLDLDETLIHSSDFPPHSQVSYFKSGNPEFYVHKRPGLDKFLEFVKNNFEIFIFTFGDRAYAEPVLDVLCPFIDNEHRFYRDSCETRSGTVKKDLNIFNRDKKNLILIDDSSSAITHNPKNTITIPRWKGSPLDDALTKWLPPILNECLASNDVRDAIHHAQQQQKIEKKKRTKSFIV